jgi:GDP-4-dehydro-6-deoxy-D-mannose reductase
VGSRVLITGITGMAGSHLADYLLAANPDAQIFGTRRSTTKLDNIAHALDRVQLLDCDLLDRKSCVSVLAEVKPDFIFHLAGRTFIPDSWEDPHSTIVGNVSIQLNLFEAVRATNIEPTIVVALSSDEYGKVSPADLPIKETTPFRPASPYGVSKVSQDMLAIQYHQSFGMRIIRMRPFNHEGPRRGAGFVTSSFAKQIAEIEAGLREPVVAVGDLSASRDWTDVRDVVRGYWLAAQRCTPGDDYNICSGVGRTVESMLTLLLRLSESKIEVRNDVTRLRKFDLPALVGDPTKFCNATGWKQEISFEQTMQDLLDFWRNCVGSSKVSLKR